MAHAHAHKHAAIAAIFLRGRALKVYVPDFPVDQRANLLRYLQSFVVVGREERVVVECRTVKQRYEEKRPVRAAFGFHAITAVVYGKEYVGCVGEVWEGILECARVWGLV